MAPRRSSRIRVPSAAPTGRCSSRTARAPTCTRRRSRPSPTRSRRRACRRCVSTSRTAPPGRRAPDRPPVLEAAVRDGGRRARAPVQAAGRAAGARRPFDGRPHLLDGRGRCRRSGRRARSGVARVPAAPAGATGEAPDRALPADQLARAVRQWHARRVRDTRRSCGGTRRRCKAPVAFHWVETGDHGFKPLKSSGATVESVLADVAGGRRRFRHRATRPVGP